MPFFTADDDTRVYYEEHGNSASPPLVLLPGLLGSLSIQWRDYIPTFAAAYRVVAINLRGHGQSGNNNAVLRLDDMVRDITGLLDALGIKSAHIAGYSLGGYLGLMLHLHQPERVRTLLMHATKFYWNDSVIEGMKKQMRPEVIKSKVPHYATHLAHEHGKEKWEQLLAQSAEMVEHMVLLGITEEQAALATCPVLVSAGNRDELIPVQELLALSQTIPTAELFILPGVHHSFSTIPPALLIPAMQKFHQ